MHISVSVVLEAKIKDNSRSSSSFEQLLGYTDIRTTQIYGKIVQKKISVDMKKLKDKLSVSNKNLELTKG